MNKHTKVHTKARSPGRAIQALTLAVSLIASAASSHAALVVNDNFDYGGTNLEFGYGSWQDGTSQARYVSGTTASWGGDSNYALNGAGGSFNAFMFGSSTTYRGAQLDLESALSGTFWLSVMIREEIAPDDDSGAVVAFNQGAYSGTSGWGPGDAFALNGNGNLATTTGSGISLSEEAGPIGLPAGWGLYIAKITVGVGDDSIDLWAFDTSDSFGTTEASLGAAKFSSGTVQYGDTITSIWLGVGAGSPGSTSHAYFDNLRISDLSGDDGLQEVLSGVVIPEPGTLGLMLSALLGYMLLRLRKRK